MRCCASRARSFIAFALFCGRASWLFAASTTAGIVFSICCFLGFILQVPQRIFLVSSIFIFFFYFFCFNFCKAALIAAFLSVSSLVELNQYLEICASSESEGEVRARG